ncbi:MAG: class I SAM-dependent methyltransferase, partial [Gemmatimonadales bacterium]|jgi:cyclopropane fatty-acyl-phospholipid synthase-like methyltransferase
MVDTILDLVARRRPHTVLDVGAGVGNVAHRVLETLPDAQLVAVDASAVMVEDAGQRLSPFGDRVRVVHTDVADFTPERPFDAIYSNLVIHNIPFMAKPGVLARIANWLTPDGVFVWSDLTRYDDVRLQEHFVRYRIGYALAAGCDRSFVRVSFDKEANEDYPYTVDEALAAARGAGLTGEVVWAHDTFAVLHLTP